MKFAHKLVEPPKKLEVVTVKGKREYIAPDGEKYESVTTYLDRTMDKTFLVEWQKRIGVVRAEKERLAAVQRGTMIHKITEKYVNNEPLDLSSNPIIKARFAKVRIPLDRLNNIRLIETAIYSDKLKLAGTPDIVAEYLSKLAVVDMKTSKKIKKKEWILSYFLQMACYGVMYDEHFGEMPELAVIIMATEACEQAQVFIEPMKVCIGMLNNYRKDPVRFQERLKRYTGK